ncbi:MAG: Prolipoprotein diacylglyceryl transferase [Acidobacteria bacterium]|nr:Prolipoprotein diacylglyceryl transferase [Acidobacteriota bacterium]
MDGALGPARVFGLLVLVAVVVGAAIAGRRARSVGLAPARFDALVFWTVASGIAAAHVVAVLLTDPSLVLHRPAVLLQIGNGLSSFGGFLGAMLGFLVFTRLRRLPRWESADAIACGLPFGWFFGRMGCALVHDHPGIASGTFLAVRYPDGMRLDLGLIEMLLTPLLMAAVWWAARRPTPPGRVITTLALGYPVVRFPLDFLRAPLSAGGDVRVLGLTPGQYGSVALLALGLALWFVAPREAPGIGVTSPSRSP